MIETHPKGSKARILLSSVFGPYAQDDTYGSRTINPMELYHNQVTRGQGSFSLRSFHRSWGILMIQGNISAPCAVLDFPTREAFARELTTHHYDIVGISSIIVNVGNFTKPAAGQPALISFDDVTTMFHEFGHALHGLFGNEQYPSLSGANTARDFVEFPSQFNEHWASYPEVFANYAKHWQTGEAMPAELQAKLKATKNFNGGHALTEVLAAAEVDLQWHTLPPDAELQHPANFEAEALKTKGVANALVPPRYRSTYFSHIFGGGYAAGYYAYLWAEMLDADAYHWFEQNGGLTRANGDRLRQMVLSRGNTADPATLYREWAGRDPVIGPMLQERGIPDSSVVA